jgi:hypothetical protein
MIGIDGYFPVPTKSRESNVYFPICSWSVMIFLAFSSRLAAGDGDDDFNHIAGLEFRRVDRTATHNVVVPSNGDSVAPDAERGDHVTQRRFVIDFMWPAVHANRDHAT